MSGRKLLKAALTAALPGWQIVADARALDGIRKPGAVVLWTARRTRPAKLQLDVVTDEVTVWILTATDKPADVEDDLDELFTAVADALEPLDWCAWTEAERGTLADRYEGWRLTITCLYTITEE